MSDPHGPRDSGETPQKLWPNCNILTVHEPLMPNSDPSPTRHSLLQIMACGGLAGILSDMLIHPLDVVKTRQQAQLTNLAKNKYKSVYQTFGRILSEEGWRGLYAGMAPAFIGSVASHTLYFGIYEATKRRLLEHDVDPAVAYFMAGAIGDGTAAFIYVPTEVLKTRMQLQGIHNNSHSISPHNYRHFGHAFQEIWKARGIQGVYHGLGATILRDAPFTAIQFMTYESLKSFILSHTPQMSFAQELTIGALAGIAAGALTTPLDTVKTYLQTQTKRKKAEVVVNQQFVRADGIPLAPHYSGVQSAVTGIYGRSGWRGLFRGMGPRVLWTGCQSCVMFVLYETFLSLL